MPKSDICDQIKNYIKDISSLFLKVETKRQYCDFR